MVELNEKQQEIQNIVHKDVFDRIAPGVVIQMAILTFKSTKAQIRTHCKRGFLVHNFTFDYFPKEIDLDEVQINWPSIVMQAYTEAIPTTNHVYVDNEVAQALGKRNFDRLVATYKVALGECFDLLGYCRSHYPNKYKLNNLLNSLADDDLADKYEAIKNLWQMNWERFVCECELLTKLLNNLDEMDEEGDQQC